MRIFWKIPILGLQNFRPWNFVLIKKCEKMVNLNSETIIIIKTFVSKCLVKNAFQFIHSRLSSISYNVCVRNFGINIDFGTSSQHLWTSKILQNNLSRSKTKNSLIWSTYFNTSRFNLLLQDLCSYCPSIAQPEQA